MRVLSSLLFVLILFAGWLPAQVPSSSAMAPAGSAQASPAWGNVSVTPIAGARPGTLRQLVTLRSSAKGGPAVDRSALAQALRGPAKDEATLHAVRVAIAELRRVCEIERQPFAQRLELLGGRIVEPFWLIDACVVELPAHRVGELRADPDVARVDADTLVGLAAPIDEAASTANHAVRQVHKLGLRGQGLTMAILDTGLDEKVGQLSRPHAVYYPDGDPSNKTGPGIAGSRLLANIQVGKQSPDDVSGHGTAVSAVAVGARWNQLRGVGAGHAPEALIVGYALADTKSGETQASTMVRACEALVQDCKLYGYGVANFSYLGHPDPMHPAQQALDRAQQIADLLITTPAGNSGITTQFSMSNANGLAVGAVHSNTRRVALFSSRGPLHGDSQRFFPDLCACGVGLVMPEVDNEATTYSTIGTSTAAPQVGGSALLLRGLLPHLSALETKAALLASTDDVSMHNQLPPYDTRNAYGLGYLRSDRLIDFARNQRGLWRSATLDPSSQELRVPFSFEKGKRYGIVVTWHRMDVTRPDWSDLRLSVQDGPQELVFSDDTRNLYEKLVFDATSSQTLDVVASVKNLVDPQLPIGLVICELDAPSRLGAIHTLGPSCRGSGKGQGIRRILPEGKADVFGDTWSPVPLGHFNHRFMQLFDMRSQTQAMRIEGLALRHDDIEVFRHLDYEVELEVRMGYAKHRPGKIDKVFANNYASAPITVMTRKRIRLPVLESANTDPRNFEIRLPFDKAFTYAPVQGQYLVVELVRLDSNLGNTGLFYMLDASSDPGLSVSAVYENDPNATSGNVWLGHGVIFGFITSDGQGEAWPSLTPVSVPILGRSFRLEVDRARPGSPGIFGFGLSKDRWLGVPLPLDFGLAGAPGCMLHSSLDLMHPVLFDSKGHGFVDLPIPSWRSWAGLSLYLQGVVLDNKANSLGLVLTNAIEARVAGDL
jgi:hypothetical protein